MTPSPNSQRTAHLVRIGIADDDPSRVLTTCRSIFVSLGPMDSQQTYLLQRLGVPTGPKVIHCERHRYGLMGTTLDEAYSAFQTKYCTNCPDREARDKDWRYSREWHDREGKRLAALVYEFRTNQHKR